MTLDHEDIAAIADAVFQRMAGLVSPVAEMGSVSACIHPGLVGSDLEAFMDARQREIRAKRRGK